jgi:hypothetical protein
MFRCQQPRIITTAAPVTPAAITPAGQNQFTRPFFAFDFWDLAGVSLGTTFML